MKKNVRKELTISHEERGTMPMKEWEIRRKKKRFILKILVGLVVVIAVFTLIIGAMVNRIKSNQLKNLEKHQEQQAKMEELQKTPVIVAEPEVEENRYLGLALLSFLKDEPSRNEFKSELERYIRRADYYGEYTEVVVEGKDAYDEILKVRRFYLTLDNEEQSRIEGLYDEQTKECVFGYYAGER
ncbi:hypothetical protein [Ohessyouella blattaphilus]|uniref:hypothetical protein n=1 Tax=Ohessyouella blattaphilus TaxID=2949333 RepID=UPI003EBE33FF